jgi:hypothetical protein
MTSKEDTIVQNKSALIDELGNSLSTANDFINDAIEHTEGGKPEDLLSSMIGLAHQIGYMTAVFNQFIIFERGMPEPGKKIGFGSMLSGKKEGD